MEYAEVTEQIILPEISKQREDVNSRAKKKKSKLVQEKYMNSKSET